MNNIAAIYYAQGNFCKALEYQKQSLVICREASDLAGEAVASWWIGLTYEELGRLTKAEEYMSQGMKIMCSIGHPKLETCCEGLERVRAKRQAA